MLHSQTTLILAALLFLALPVMVWLALRSTSERAVAWWCAGGWMAGTGIVLMGLRPWLPAVVSFQVANTCVLGSLVLWSQSLRVSYGQPWRPAVVVTLLLLCAGFYSLVLAWATPSMRGLLVRVALGLLAFHTAYWAWRLSRHLRSGNAATIAVAYLVLGLMLTVQGIWTAHAISVPSPFSNTWDASLLALTALVTAMICHFCYVGMVLDQAANERVEAQLAQQGLRHAQWLGAELQRMDRRRRMAILSGSLAHELNQPLTVALMNAQLAQRQLGAGAPATAVLVKLLEQVEAGIDRTAAILQRIRAGSDPDWPGLREVDLHRVLEQSLAQVEPDMRRLGVDLALERSPGPLLCLGDELALSQVLVNLMRNAVQAMADQPQRLLSVVCGEEQGRLQVRVLDTGPGLSAPLNERWGEPLLSTRTEGLGMGLAISLDIVARHRGELSLRNHPQGGAEALLSLPSLPQPGGGQP